MSQKSDEEDASYGRDIQAGRHLVEGRTRGVSEGGRGIILGTKSSNLYRFLNLPSSGQTSNASEMRSARARSFLSALCFRHNRIKVLGQHAGWSCLKQQQ